MEYFLLVFVATDSVSSEPSALAGQLIDLFFNYLVIVICSYRLLADFLDFHIKYTFSWRQLCLVLGVQLVVSVAHIYPILR